MCQRKHGDWQKEKPLWMTDIWESDTRLVLDRQTTERQGWGCNSMIDDLTHSKPVPGDKKEDSMTERRAIAWKDLLHGTAVQTAGCWCCGSAQRKTPPKTELQPKHKQHPILPQKMKPVGHWVQMTKFKGLLPGWQDMNNLSSDGLLTSAHNYHLAKYPPLDRVFIG